VFDTFRGRSKAVEGARRRCLTPSSDTFLADTSPRRRLPRATSSAGLEPSRRPPKVFDTTAEAEGVWHHRRGPFRLCAAARQGLGRRSACQAALPFAEFSAVLRL